MAWVPTSTIRSSDEGWINGWKNTETGEFTDREPAGALTQDQVHRQMWDSLSGSPQEKINQSLDKGYGGLPTWAVQQGLISQLDLQSNQRYVNAVQDSQRRMADNGGFVGFGQNFFFPALTAGMLAGAGGAALGYGGGATGATTGTAGAGGTAAATEAALSSATPFAGGGAATTAGAGGLGAEAALAGGAAAAAMPAATPEADPTFGGELTQTAPGAYENLGNTAAFGGGLAPTTSALAGGGTLAATAASGASGGSSGGSGGSGTSGGGGSGSDGFFGLQDDEWLRRLSYGIPGLIGAIGAGAQAEDYQDLAHQYQQMGAPYRSRLEQLYGNPEAFLNSPEVRQPIQQGTDMLARSLSVKGNPAGSGNALQELQNYASTQLFNRLGQEKDRLAGFGGLSQYNQAAPQAATNVIGAQGNVYSNLGGATADIFNPPRRYTLQDLMRAY